MKVQSMHQKLLAVYCRSGTVSTEQEGRAGDLPRISRDLDIFKCLCWGSIKVTMP